MQSGIFVKFTAVDTLINFFGIATWVLFWNEILDSIRVDGQLSIFQEDAAFGSIYLLANDARVMAVDEKMAFYIDGLCQNALGLITSRLAKLEISGFNVFGYKKSQYLFCNHKEETKIKLYSIPLGELKNIIDNNLILPYVQPIVNSSGYDSVGYECLSRPLVGSNIVTANDLFDTALQQNVNYELEFICVSKMLNLINCMVDGEFLSINISPLLLLDKMIISLFERVKEKRKLKVELTENQFVEDWGKITFMINKFKKDGLDIWLDDVGSGYFDFNIVGLVQPVVTKIYIGLIHQVCEDIYLLQDFKNLVKSIHSFGGKILAEGVETKKQADLMKSIGVDYMQGYYFGKPVPMICDIS